eukprot:19215-Eustigmatos_ZCMA.PRE.1
MTIIRAAESPAEAKVYKSFFKLLTATRGQVLSLVLTDHSHRVSRHERRQVLEPSAAAAAPGAGWSCGCGGSPGQVVGGGGTGAC